MRIEKSSSADKLLALQSRAKRITEQAFSDEKVWDVAKRWLLFASLYTAKLTSCPPKGISRFDWHKEIQTALRTQDRQLTHLENRHSRACAKQAAL